MSTHHYHAVIWIDHHEARVFHFNPTDVERLILHPDHPTRHIHHKANSIGSGHVSEDHHYLQEVAQSIEDAGAILITGPANAKTELVRHIHRHDPRLTSVIVGVETVDHPSDAELVAYARKYFSVTDRMQAQKTSSSNVFIDPRLPA
jgi:hypothetical protein